jgi:hypothetical protein
MPANGNNKTNKKHRNKNKNKSRVKNAAKTALKFVKPLAKGVLKRGLGVAGLVLGATKTATADTVNTVKDGVTTNKYTGKKSKSLF